MKLTIITPTYQLVDLIYWQVHFSRFRNPPDYPVETIIVDGGSDQYIRGKLKELEKAEIPNIRVIFVEGNKHDSYNINAAVKIAKGEFVLKLDSDVFVTRKIFWEILLKALEDNPTALVGYSASSYWTRGHGRIFGGFCMAWKRDVGIEWDEEYLGFGPSDQDFGMRFLDKGYPLVLLPRPEEDSLWHLGGLGWKMYYAKPREQLKEEFSRNSGIFFRKWEDKFSRLKGFL